MYEYMDAGTAEQIPLANRVWADVKAKCSSRRTSMTQNYDIDFENDVVMRLAPRLHLVQASLVHYVGNWQSVWLTKDRSPF